jgi:lipoprotein-releasing system ATP-binding protein
MEPLVAEHLGKTYPLADGRNLEILQDVSLRVEPGHSVAVVGPSGSGKSTLLAILGGLEAPTTGQIQVAGQNPNHLNESQLAEFRARHIGFVFQDHYLLPQCTVLENVLIPRLASGSATADDAQRARQLIAQVGLAERASHRPAMLSGGERQRAALARALILGPSVLLADEPTGNLDGKTAQEIADLMLDLQREQGTILIAATHSRELAARMDCAYRLADGHLTLVTQSVAHDE